MLTDDEIIAIADATKSAEPGSDGYILPITFARSLLAANEAKKNHKADKADLTPDAVVCTVPGEDKYMDASGLVRCAHCGQPDGGTE